MFTLQELLTQTSDSSANELLNEDLEQVTAGAAKSLWGGGGYQLGQQISRPSRPGGYVPYSSPRGIKFPSWFSRW